MDYGLLQSQVYKEVDGKEKKGSCLFAKRNVHMMNITVLYDGKNGTFHEESKGKRRKEIGMPWSV